MKIELKHVDTCHPSELAYHDPDTGGVLLSVGVEDDMTEQEMTEAILHEWINSEDEDELMSNTTARDIRQALPSIQASLTEARHKYSRDDGVFVYISVKPAGK